MNTGGKNEADLLGALRRGGLDAAAEMLKQIHDTRDAGQRLAARHRLVSLGPRLRAEALGLSGLAYELAQLQGEMLSRVLGIQRRHATAVQRRVETALGVGTAETPSAALQATGPGPEFALRFRVKNTLPQAGPLGGSLEGEALTDAQDTRHLAKASLEFPSVLGADRVLPAGTVTLLTLRIACPSAEKGARLQGRYLVTVGKTPALSLHLDLHIS